MTMLLWCVAISLFSTDQSPVLHRCNFNGLPLEVLSHIASYLHFTNKVYESDDFFIERVRKSQGMLQEAQLSNDCLLTINKSGLEVVTTVINAASRSNLIESIDPYKPLIDFRSDLDNKTEAKQVLVKYFALSPSYKYLAAVKTVHNFENGLYLGADIVCVFTFDEVLRKYNLEYQSSSYRDTIKRIAISNEGAIMMLRDEGLFLAKRPGKKPTYWHSLGCPVKWLSLFISPSGLAFLSNDSYKMGDILFNKQSNKIAVKLHYLYKYYMGKNHSSQTFNKLVREWFCRNYDKFTEISHLFDRNLSEQQLINQLSIRLLNSECAKIVRCGKRCPHVSDTLCYDAIWIKFRTGIDESCPVEIASLLKEETWTLEKYFGLKGVCKNLNKQCVFKVN